MQAAQRSHADSAFISKPDGHHLVNREAVGGPPADCPVGSPAGRVSPNGASKRPVIPPDRALFICAMRRLAWLIIVGHTYNLTTQPLSAILAGLERLCR